MAAGETAPSQTLGEVAREYHVTLASLENVNLIDPHDPPAVGTELIVPAAPPRQRLVHYRVKRGDTLDNIASRYSVSTAELQRWNHLRTERAPRGRTLRIYEDYYPTAKSPPSARLRLLPRAGALHRQRRPRSRLRRTMERWSTACAPARRSGRSRARMAQRWTQLSRATRSWPHAGCRSATGSASRHTSKHNNISELRCMCPAWPDVALRPQVPRIPGVCRVFAP